MSKKKRQKKRNKKNSRNTPLRESQLPVEAVNFQDEGGLHFLIAGEVPSPEIFAKMTEAYQQKIRNSPIFEIWVKQFGHEMAEKLLNECRAELRSSF